MITSIMSAAAALVVALLGLFVKVVILGSILGFGLLLISSLKEIKQLKRLQQADELEVINTI